MARDGSPEPLPGWCDWSVRKAVDIRAVLPLNDLRRKAHQPTPVLARHFPSSF